MMSDQEKGQQQMEALAVEYGLSWQGEMLNWKFEKDKKHPREENQLRKIIGDMFNQYNITGDTSLTSLGTSGS